MQQQRLFEPNDATNGLRDPSFSHNKRFPLHRWVPWVAGFSSEFVDDCLKKYLPHERRGEAWVLDPFSGVGTTLVEGYSHGHNVIGFEINPYAALAARLKLEATKVSTKPLSRYVADFEDFMQRAVSSIREPKCQPPTGFSGRTRLFCPKVERKILFSLDFINSIKESRIKDLFRLALGSVMVSVSNYTYEPSLTRRSAVDKPDIQDASVAAIISGKLRLMLEDIKWLQRHMRELGCSPEAKLFNVSFFRVSELLGETRLVDLVVTSPPYLNNYHYPRNTRPQLHWLGFTSGRGYDGAREDESFGKFWQTVRASLPVPLSFRLPDLEAIIREICNLNRHKGSYGGPGWANYVATYFNDTYKFCHLLARLLRHNGIAIVVLGNSVIQGVEVKTDCFFGKIAELCGLKFEDTLLLRKKRTGTSIIQSSVRADKAAQETLLYESAIILRM